MSDDQQREQKRKAIEHALAGIEKEFGKGAVMKMDGTGSRGSWPSISTGSLGVDIATGIGGVPRGRISEIYGPESSGKTTLMLQVVAEAQKAGGTCAFVDAEHALDPEYARKLGCNIDELYVAQPDTGEQALEITERLIRSGGFDVVVVDSVAALVPRAELEGDMGDNQPGLQARLMSQAMRKITGAVKSTNTSLLMVNQIRMKIGVMFGSPETTTGGNALKFYASMRFDIRRIGSVKDGENVIGNRVKVKIAKNKMNSPFKTAEFDLIFGEGVSYMGELIDLGIEAGIIQKAGAWHSFGNTRLGHGKAKTAEFLALNADVSEEIDRRVRAAYGLGGDAAADEAGKDSKPAEPAAAAAE
ncbi:recombinase RecA [Rhodovibrio sodomensis]|uniref:Protein RecA n=1 Tax=Rhodovibrio sodomensis TaxID=1088 RepID=A0ABS1D950_9PROT|nr:recombinase RecA [Rhodovibrio sodomensis]MBK1666426.1 recombinase RecA [Rhodovibrio sodomensis]